MKIEMSEDKVAGARWGFIDATELATFAANTEELWLAAFEIVVTVHLKVGALHGKGDSHFVKGH